MYVILGLFYLKYLVHLWFILGYSTTRRAQLLHTGCEVFFLLKWDTKQGRNPEKETEADDGFGLLIVDF